MGRRPGADVHELVERRLEQRDVAIAADAVAAGAPEAGEERDHRRVAGREIDERQAGLRRRPVGLAGERLPAGEALHHVVVAAFRRPRAGHAEARERAAHDAGVHVLQLVVGEAELGRLVAPEVRVHRIGDAHEVVEDRRRIRVAEVERDRLLVAVERLEEDRVLALLEGRHVAPDVTPRGRILDLDHLGAEICQLQGAPRPGAELLDGENADVSEWQRHGWMSDFDRSYALEASGRPRRGEALPRSSCEQRQEPVRRRLRLRQAFS